MNSKKPVLALTMGDPAGIGPEIAVKAIEKCLTKQYSIVIVGDYSIIKESARSLQTSRPVVAIKDMDSIVEGAINVLDMYQLNPDDYKLGEVQAQCGKAAYSYIVKAIALAKEGIVQGVVTNPINKEALRAAGIDYPGHTEIFAKETGVSNFSMMFLLDNVAVAHVTTHCSLRDAIEKVKKDSVLATIYLLDKTLHQLGIKEPRIAVGGLNPHAGEHGLFGTEEIDHIEPAIEAAREKGIIATGPFPPDTVFMRAFKGEFDGIVAMLHDHGFVALKSRDFEHGVNVTIGLPIIRTSVGHGTAFNIAGKGIASEASLITALDTAYALYLHRA